MVKKTVVKRSVGREDCLTVGRKGTWYGGQLVEMDLLLYKVSIRIVPTS